MIEVILAFSLYIDYLCKYYPDMEECKKEVKVSEKKIEQKKAKEIPKNVPIRIIPKVEKK